MQIVIIGNSAAGLSCLETFRKLDRDSGVTLLSREGARPYSRVLLPYYLRKKVPHDNLFIRGDDYYSSLDAEILEATVVKVHPEQHAVELADGTRVDYDRLLVATGSSPVPPPVPGLSGENVLHLWTLDDAVRLDSCFDRAGHVVVLGSGFVALQGACAARSRGLGVAVVELKDRIMPTALDPHGAGLLAEKMIRDGVDLRTGTLTTNGTRAPGGGFTLNFAQGPPIETDLIIVATGVRPNVEFLQGTGVRIERGIVVNSRMETSLPDIYAAGDVAQVPSFGGRGSVVHALWPTAIETGSIAGATMACGATGYKGSLNMNVTQMFDLTVASMGDFMDVDGGESWIDDTLEQDQYLKIVLQDGVPCGATCVGNPELVSSLGILRPLIRERVRLPGKPEMLREIMAKNMSQHHEAFAKRKATGTRGA